MAKTMKITAALSTLAAAAAIATYCIFRKALLLSLAITFCTIAYHFIMRLIVGIVVDGILNNHADYTKKWFQPRTFEAPLYRLLRVKKWKKNMPSYDPSLFSAKEHSPEEIVQAMCQAEIVHEIIALLSFLPLFASIRFDSFWVFFITSVLSAGFDLMFVIMQRYNRPRLLRIMYNNKNKTVK